MSHSHAPSLVVCAALTLLLAGCANSTPAATSTPEATATSSPTPEPPAVAALVVGGAALTAVDDAGAEIWKTSYTADPAEVVATLAELFESAPEVVDHPGDESCTPADTRASWGGFTISYDTDFLPEGQLFQVLATTPAVDDVSIRTPQSAAVGSSFTEISSGLPAEQIGQEYEWENGVGRWVDYEVAGGAYSDPNATESFDGSLPEYWGAKARLLDGTVELLMAPTVFVSYC